ncbi:uncharacterized protein B0H64DRAFT_396315 [Chaetomium fimeti]|uniref:Secreted protein n=1 Tax=Chaetomium fimeti TaxID=1854472 RepID=A0AAE0HGB0_9PEZI|nr:hypothetical protein B0H64DRAFT_396315 [Chaetomium fimeti]
MFFFLLLSSFPFPLDGRGMSSASEPRHPSTAAFAAPCDSDPLRLLDAFIPFVIGARHCELERRRGETRFA